MMMFISGFSTGIPVLPAICEMSFFRHQNSIKTARTRCTFGVFAYVFSVKRAIVRRNIKKKIVIRPSNCQFSVLEVWFFRFFSTFYKNMTQELMWIWSYGSNLVYKSNFSRRKIIKNVFGHPASNGYFLAVFHFHDIFSIFLIFTWEKLKKT